MNTNFLNKKNSLSTHQNIELKTCSHLVKRHTQLGLKKRNKLMAAPTFANIFSGRKCNRTGKVEYLQYICNGSGADQSTGSRMGGYSGHGR